MLLHLQPTDGSTPLRVIAVDPGRVAIVTCGEWVCGEEGAPRWSSWRLTRSQFHAEAGYKSAQRSREHWNLEVADAHAALAGVSVRTASLAKFNAYLDVLETHLDALWENRCHTRWMRLDFASKRRARMSREGFWRKVRAGRDSDGTVGVSTVVAYGDGSFSSSAGGAAAAPTSAMRTSCVAVFGAHAVKKVGEFYSSAKHAVAPDGSVCGKFLQDVIDERVGHCKRARSGPPPRGAARRVVVRGMKRCPTCSIFEDRDANACRNMLCAYWASERGQPRPAYLRPPSLTPDTPSGGAGGVSGRPPAYTRSARPK